MRNKAGYFLDLSFTWSEFLTKPLLCGCLFGVTFWLKGNCNFADLQKFETELVQQEQKVADCIRLGENIQKRAHSDAIPTLKHWLTILEARWAEVKNLSSQRRKRLRDSLEVSQSNAHLLDELTQWLGEMETTLKSGSQKPIPENIPIVEQLLQDHAVSPVPTVV